MRPFISFVAFFGVALAVAFAVPAPQAAPDRVAGNWQVIFSEPGEILTLWLLKLENKGGKLAGTLESAPKAPPAAVDNVALEGDTLKIGVDLQGRKIALTFNLPKGENKRLFGTLSLGDVVFPAQLEATKDKDASDLKTFVEIPAPKGDFKDIKNEIARRADDIAVFTLANHLIAAAAEGNVAVDDLKQGLAPAFQAARNYGNWHQEFQFHHARKLVGTGKYAGLGEEYAQEALKGVANGSVSSQLRIMDLLAVALDKQNKKDELTKVRARINDMEVKGHAENEKSGLGFTPAESRGPKGKRVVVVELFTGAQCPPCVAADLAFEGLAKTYSPADVVLLQYHLHIPGPDPMTTPETQERAQYYGEAVRGTPSILFNGKSAAGGGGPKEFAEKKYQEYRGVIDPLLAGENKINLSLAAARNGDALTLNTTVSGFPADNDNLKLRLALIEPWVRFAGSNGLSYHAHVVRALPGGVRGFALGKEARKESVTLDLAEIRKAASTHLDTKAALDGQRPFSYRNLHAVAFVQDDETKEILHAVEVPVK